MSLKYLSIIHNGKEYTDMSFLDQERTDVAKVPVITLDVEFKNNSKTHALTDVSLEGKYWTMSNVKDLPPGLGVRRTITLNAADLYDDPATTTKEYDKAASAILQYTPERRTG